MTLLETVRAFTPGCEQEEADRRLMLEYMELFPQLLTRENETAHFTASCWITAPDQSRVLMAYHNQYDSWAWLGGQATCLRLRCARRARNRGCVRCRR